MKRGVLPGLLIAGLVVTGAVAYRAGLQSAPADRPDGSPSTASSPLVSPPTRSTVASPPEAPPPGREAVARAFVAAFLDTSSARPVRLEATCSPRLAELLAETDPAEVSTARPVGAPVLTREGSQGVSFVQRLADDTSFAFDLVVDATRPSGWAVTSVRPGDS